MKYFSFSLTFGLIALALQKPVLADDVNKENGQKKENTASTVIGQKKEDAPPVPFEVDTRTDIAYRTDSEADPARHKLDLYLPKGQKGFPVLFFVHGGSWSKGDKQEYKMLGEMFAAQGIGTVIINYRLSPQVQHPAHIQDVAKAFAWTHKHISEYGGKPDRIIVCGHSAGGQLVTLLVTDDFYLKEEKLDRRDIRAVVAISGVYSLSPVIPVFRRAFGKSRDMRRDASPLNHVDGKLPPFLLLYADRDVFSLGRMAEEMEGELKKNNTDVTLQRIDKRNHVNILTEMANETDPARQAILQFVAKETDWKPLAGAKTSTSEKKP